MTEEERKEASKKYPALVEAMEDNNWVFNFERLPHHKLHQIVPHELIPKVIQ